MAFRQHPDRPCPGCGRPTSDDTTRCEQCGYGLRAELQTEHRRARHRTLFSSDDAPGVDARLSREFRCPHCRSFGASVRTLNYITGGELRHVGASAIATCHFCGAQQLFDLEAFERSPGVRWDLLDD